PRVRRGHPGAQPAGLVRLLVGRGPETSRPVGVPHGAGRRVPERAGTARGLGGRGAALAGESGGDRTPEPRLAVRPADPGTPSRGGGGRGGGAARRSRAAGGGGTTAGGRRGRGRVGPRRRAPVGRTGAPRRSRRDHGGAARAPVGQPAGPAAAR